MESKSTAELCNINKKETYIATTNEDQIFRTSNYITKWIRGKFAVNIKYIINYKLSAGST